MIFKKKPWNLFQVCVQTHTEQGIIFARDIDQLFGKFHFQVAFN